MCIASNGRVNIVFSPQDMVSCDRSNFGCQGGYLNKAWEYLERTGVTTDSCEPYVSGGGSVPGCPGSCRDGKPFKRYHCQSGSVRQANGAAATKALIESSGPVETGFTVYADFFNYRGGIYHHTSGGSQGGHAVKIIGWGRQGNENFWIVANSWGLGWGEGGFFRIREGDSGINDATFGCTPNVNGVEYDFTQ